MFTFHCLKYYVRSLGGTPLTDLINVNFFTLVTLIIGSDSPCLVPAQVFGLQYTMSCHSHLEFFILYSNFSFSCCYILVNYNNRICGSSYRCSQVTQCYVLNCVFVVCFYIQFYYVLPTLATVACSVLPSMSDRLTHTPSINSCQFSIATGCSVHIT